jgi:hypothetical protein
VQPRLVWEVTLLQIAGLIIWENWEQWFTATTDQTNHKKKFWRRCDAKISKLFLGLDLSAKRCNCCNLH